MRLNILKYTLLPVLLILLVLPGCNAEKEEKVSFPENILKEEELTKLLTSFALAESAANMNIKSVPAYKMDTVYAFNPLVENNVRPTQYDSTLAFYANHPKLYKKVYEAVLTELSLLQTKRDSIKGVKDPK